MASKTAARYEIFAREYVIDLNGSRAAQAAGIAESGARVWASRALTKANVQRQITQLQAKRASKLGITADKVAEELQRLAFSNMMDYMEIDEDGQPRGLDLTKLTRDQAAAIQEISEDATGGQGDGERRLVIRRKFKLADKRGSLELLGRHLGMFQDNVKITGLEGLAERMAELRKSDAGS
jgi:phage terminase small subunit